MKVSTLLGFRPNDSVMSYNEILWWEAYGSCRPLAPDRIDILEARLVAVQAGKSPSDVVMDWFTATPENDKDMELERDAERVKIAKQLESDRKRKLKEND